MKPDNKDGQHIKVQVTEQLHVSEPHSNSHPVLLCEKELNVLSFKSANLNLKIGLALEYFCFLLDQPSLCSIFCGHLSPVPGIQSSGKDHPNVFGTLDNSISILKTSKWLGQDPSGTATSFYSLHRIETVCFSYKWTKPYQLHSVTHA